MSDPSRAADAPIRNPIAERRAAFVRDGYGPVLFAPAVMLAAFLWADAVGLIAACAAFSAYLLALSLTGRPARLSAPPSGLRDPATGLDLEDGFVDRTEIILAACASRGQSTAVFLLQIDDENALVSQYGRACIPRVLLRLSERLGASMRAGDVIARLDGARLAIALHPTARLDTELALDIAARLQAAASEPLALAPPPRRGRAEYAPSTHVAEHAAASPGPAGTREGTVESYLEPRFEPPASARITVSVGFCTLESGLARSAAALVDGAATALCEARRAGPGSIRAFSPDMRRAAIAHAALVEEAETALASGEIRAWFQPQLCTDTGRVSGLEALVRWEHPQRGLLPTREVLAALHAADLTPRLDEAILRNALETLRRLDGEGLHVPRVAVNFTRDALADPRLPDRIRWSLDRLDLAPGRLAVEILESVVAGPSDGTLIRNVTQLHLMDCGIELDDFGTGHASITSLRQFPIDRLKIDRSFVTRCDAHAAQQRMLTAILTMAEQLGMETLAEGVETVGEHALLAQLGVGHVQGFGIARPMPPERLAEWIRAHEARLPVAPPIGGAAR